MLANNMHGFMWHGVLLPNQMATRLALNIAPVVCAPKTNLVNSFHCFHKLTAQTFTLECVLHTIFTLNQCFISQEEKKRKGTIQGEAFEKESESKVFLFCLLACALIIEGGMKACCLCCLCLSPLIQMCINIIHTQSETHRCGWVEKHL